MAKKINKKVALIGLGVFLLMGVAAVMFLLSRFAGPEKFVQDGDMLFEQAKQEPNETLREETFSQSTHSYLRARSRAKTDEHRVEILHKILVVHFEANKWKHIRGTWDAIIRLDEKSYKSRYGKLKDFYIMATNGLRGMWDDVAMQATEFLEVADEEVLKQKPSEMESFEIQPMPSAQTIETLLYLLRGRAALEATVVGALTNREDKLNQGIADLNKAMELEPGNVEARWYLARALILKNRLWVSDEDPEKEMNRKEALEILEKCVELNPNDPTAHLNLLSLKMEIMIEEQGTRENILIFEKDYLALVEQFGSSSKVYASLASFYRLLGYKRLDDSLNAIQKAVELEPENVLYARSAANMKYRKYSIYQEKDQLDKAIEMANTALTLPDSLETEGPRYWANRTNRATLYVFLANAYVDQILDAYQEDAQDQIQIWLAEAENAIHEIEQLYGSGEEPRVIMWRGMLDLVKGNDASAIKKLHNVYEQFDAAGERNATLSYTLARLFANSSELGASAKFYANALSIADRTQFDRIDERKPEALLDYADVMLSLRNYPAIIGITTYFEREYWANERSLILRIRAYIASKQFDKAIEEMAKLEPDSSDKLIFEFLIAWEKINQTRSIMERKYSQEALADILEQTPDANDSKTFNELTVELNQYTKSAEDILLKLLEIEPNAVTSNYVIALSNNYISRDNISSAMNIVNSYLKHFPQDKQMLLQKRILEEPDAKDLPAEKLRKIEEELILSNDNTKERNMALAAFYQKYNELEKAQEQYEKILASYLDPGLESSDKADPMAGEYKLACGNLFDIALVTENWELAEKILTLARHYNIDECQGQFFAARLDIIKEDYKEALNKLNKCLEQRPIFSYAYLHRSEVNSKLGNIIQAVEDAQNAAASNPLDPTIAKVLANTLYKRNITAEESITPDQIRKLKDALIRAITLNPADISLQSVYAEYISEDEPEKALAIRQSLLRNLPTLENTIRLARMSKRMATEEKNPGKKQALFKIAGNALEQAYETDPNNKLVLTIYADYFRLTGQEEKAEKLILKNPRLLWRHYLTLNNVNQAIVVLEKLYQMDAKEEDTIRGLLLIAQRTNNIEGIKKYSDDLLKIQKTASNQLLQIELFLNFGLLNDAEAKLLRFKQDYPGETKILLLEALLSMRQGKLDHALELIKEGLEDNQQNAAAWRLKGKINQLMANYVQAVYDLKESKSLSVNPTTQIDLARAYILAGRDEEAIDELRNLIDSPQAPYEAWALLEQTYLRLSRTIALRDFYKLTQEKFAGDISWNNKAAAFALKSGELKQAEQLYEKSWQATQSDLTAALSSFEGYLQTLLLSRKLDTLNEIAVKYIDTELAAAAYLKMAQAKFVLGDKSNAIAYFRKAITKAESDESYILTILQYMFTLFGQDEVRQICNEILQKSPDSIAANIAMFSVAKLNGEYNSALSYIDKCLKVTPLDSPKRNDYAIEKARVLQAAYTKTSDNEYLNRSIAEYKSLLSKMPTNTSVLNNLAYMLAENEQNLEEALTYAEKVYEIAPNRADFLDTYAYVLYKNEKYEEAAQHVQASRQLFEQNNIPVPWDVFEHLGMIKEKLEERAEAADAYRQALKIGGDNLPDSTKQRLNSAIERLTQY